MGGGKSQGSSAPVVTEEQKAQLRAQTGLLTDTLIPAYKDTVGGAKGILDLVQPYNTQAAKSGFEMAGDVAKKGTAGGTAMINQGAAGLGSLFDQNYEQNQIKAALQAGNESAREAYGQNNAAMGAAGQLGSARAALAGQNLQSLNAQRQATAAAGAQAGVQANKAAAANSLISGGGSYLNTGLGASGQQLSMANAPLDLSSKYASIVFGTPGASGGNFAGTQGSNNTSTSFGFNLSDRNAKQDIQKIGSLDNGINLYKYQYKPEFRDQWGHGTQIGVIAQEVELVMPEAVASTDDGYKVVNYSMVLQ